MDFKSVMDYIEKGVLVKNELITLSAYVVPVKSLTSDILGELAYTLERHKKVVGFKTEDCTYNFCSAN